MSTDFFVYTEQPVVDDSCFVHLKKWKKEGPYWACRTKSWQVLISASTSIDPDNEFPAIRSALERIHSPVTFRTEIVVEGRQSNDSLGIAVASEQRIAFELNGVVYDAQHERDDAPAFRRPAGRTPAKMKFPPVYEQTPEGYVAYLGEIPEARIQAATLEEAQAKLAETVETVLAAMREAAS